MSAERRPLDWEAAHGETHRAGSDQAILPPPGDNPAELPPPAWAAYAAGYAHGAEWGIERGREVEAAELAEQWSALAVKVRAAANVPTREDLRQRRGWVA